MWTDFHEQVNDLMIEEKAARQVSDHIKLAEICTRIVSINHLPQHTSVPLFMLIILTTHLNLIQLQLALDNKQFTKVRELFLALVKRRGQAKKPVVDMVAMC